MTHLHPGTRELRGGTTRRAGTRTLWLTGLGPLFKRERERERERERGERERETNRQTDRDREELAGQRDTGRKISPAIDFSGNS